MTPANGPLFRFHFPDERLRPYISAYFFVTFRVGGPPLGGPPPGGPPPGGPPSGGALPPGGPPEALMYPEWANIRIALSGQVRIQIGDTVSSSPDCWSVISGPTTHSFKVRVLPPAATVNVGLLPTGWARFIKRSAALHADRVDPLTSVFPDHADTLRQSLLEAPDDEAACAALDRFFLSLEPPDEPISPLLARAYELILDSEIQTADQFAGALGRSGRQLSRLARDMFGFSPKTLLRRQRFMRSLVALHDNPGLPWSALIDNNYYDHSHFVRDFHQFMGMSPTQFQAMPRVDVDRVSYVRALQLGVPHQTLQVGLPVNRPVMQKS